MIAILVSVLQGQRSSFGFVAAILIPLIVVFVALGARQFWASSITLEMDELVYCTSVRTVHVSRLQIKECVIEKRLRGAIRLWVPYLDMIDGTRVRLADFSTGVRSSLDGPDYYNKRTERMLAAIQIWLNRVSPSGDQVVLAGATGVTESRSAPLPAIGAPQCPARQCKAV